jgi:hypothetical protein
MIVAIRLTDPEPDRDLVQKARRLGCGTACIQIGTRVEHQFIGAGGEFRGRQDLSIGAAIVVGDHAAKVPALAVLDPVKVDAHTLRGHSARGVQNMGRQKSGAAAHLDSNPAFFRINSANIVHALGIPRDCIPSG